MHELVATSWQNQETGSIIDGQAFQVETNDKQAVDAMYFGRTLPDCSSSECRQSSGTFIPCHCQHHATTTRPFQQVTGCFESRVLAAEWWSGDGASARSHELLQASQGSPSLRGVWRAWLKKGPGLFCLLTQPRMLGLRSWPTGCGVL